MRNKSLQSNDSHGIKGQKVKNKNSDSLEYDFK
jgi:hypothetical protein